MLNSLFKTALAALVAGFVGPANARDNTAKKLKDLDGVYVYIDDVSTDKCWTNTGEVEGYTREKLSEIGIEQDPETNWTLVITGFSNRIDGYCTGYVEIKLIRMLNSDKLFPHENHFQLATKFSDKDSMNSVVIHQIDEFMKSQ